MNAYRELLRALVDGSVEFVVIGGVAATVHGSARFMADVDVVYRRTPHDALRHGRLVVLRERARRALRNRCSDRMTWSTKTRSPSYR